MNLLYEYLIEISDMIRFTCIVVGIAYWLANFIIRLIALDETSFDPTVQKIKKALIPCGILPFILVILIPSADLLSQILYSL